MLYMNSENTMTTNDQQWLIDLFAEGEANQIPYTPPKKRVTCHKCGGTGRLTHYQHIKGGECFACNGRGVI
jgi:DnaJ-class molecular chaperone